MKLKFLITTLTLLIIHNSISAMTARDLDNYERRQRDEQNQREKENEAYTTMKVSNTTPCSTATNLVEQMFLQVKQQQEAIDKLCNLSGMKKCSDASSQKLLQEHQRNMKTLATSITQISEDALKKACSP